MSVIVVFLRPLGLRLGASESGLFEKLMDAAKILGLIVIGGMIASMVSVSTPLVLNFKDGEVGS